MADDTLKLLYDEQRKELEYRRNREYQIFTWSATVLLALIGGSLVSRSKDSVLSAIGPVGVYLAVAAVLAFTIYVLVWLLHQRRLMRAHQRVLAQIALKRGWFDEVSNDARPLLPRAWKELGNADNGKVGGLGKMAITLFLGIVASVMVWLSSRL
jgi:hypothetical protein